MKKIIILALGGALLAMSMISCEKEERSTNPLDTYLFEYGLTTAGESTYTNRGERFVFMGNFTDPSTSNALSLSIVSDSETLQSGTYTPSSLDFAVGGNYVTMDKSFPTTFTFGQYGRTYNVISGEVAITNSNGSYSVEGTLGLSNGLYVKVSFSGNVSFTFFETNESPVIDYTELSKVISSSAGDGKVTLQIATDGITVEEGMWGNTIGGSGCYISLDLYSADGSISPGTYGIGPEDGTIAPGQFAFGKNEEVSFMGMTFNIFTGSSIHTLVDGEDTTLCITSGEVVIEENGGVYTVKMNGLNEVFYFIYEGAI